MSRNRAESRSLIEQRVRQMEKRGEMTFEDDRKRHFYACLDTGMPFSTIGEQARRSPFTGSINISEQSETEFQQMTDIPSNQKNPMQQTPLEMNPVPLEPSPMANYPWQDNPAPDMQDVIGADHANGTSGYVPYPDKSVPPHVNKAPGDRTDSAPTGSK